MFCDALLRHVGNDGYFSVRAFVEDDSCKSFRISPTPLKGGLKFLLDVIEDDARRAAQFPKPVVFCPPLCTFAKKDQAREQDILEGVALSVECDAHPQQARQILEGLLGPATVVVKSGGRWSNGNGIAEDKLHLHWRLARPAQGADIAKLKQARILAARLVHGDPSNAPINHPIRWPGSWHRKAEPRLCTIETLNADIEIELDAALALLTKTAPAPVTPGNDSAAIGHADWPALISDIVSGKSYHGPLVSLAARLVGSNMHDGTTVKLLRGLMAASAGPRDPRWRSRYNAIPRYVNSARNKYAGGEPVSKRFALQRFATITLDSTSSYLVKGLIPRSGLTVIWGPPKCGKSFWAFDLTMHIAMSKPYRGRCVQQGSVVYLALEGGLGFCRRIEAFRRQHGAVDPPFYLATRPTDLIRDRAALIEDIKAYNEFPSVVCVDTLNRSLAGSESKDEDMAAYIRAADAIREAFDCAVLIVHHCGIDGSRPRGHTSLSGAADAQISVTRDAAHNIVARLEWMKDGPEDAVVVSRLEVVELGVDDDGETISSCVIVPAETVPTGPNIAVRGAAKIALEALYEAIIECGEVVQNGHIPPQTRTVPVVRWQQYCEAKMIAQTDNPDSKRRAFVRASEKLQALRIIGVWNDQIWLAGQAGQARTGHTCPGTSYPDRQTPTL